MVNKTGNDGTQVNNDLTLLYAALPFHLKSIYERLVISNNEVNIILTEEAHLENMLYSSDFFMYLQKIVERRLLEFEEILKYYTELQTQALLLINNPHREDSYKKYLLEMNKILVELIKKIDERIESLQAQKTLLKQQIKGYDIEITKLVDKNITLVNEMLSSPAAIRMVERLNSIGINVTLAQFQDEKVVRYLAENSHKSLHDAFKHVVDNMICSHMPPSERDVIKNNFEDMFKGAKEYSSIANTNNEIICVKAAKIEAKNELLSVTKEEAHLNAQRSHLIKTFDSSLPAIHASDEELAKAVAEEVKSVSTKKIDLYSKLVGLSADSLLKPSFDIVPNLEPTDSGDFKPRF